MYVLITWAIVGGLLSPTLSPTPSTHNQPTQANRVNATNSATHVNQTSSSTPSLVNARLAIQRQVRSAVNTIVKQSKDAKVTWRDLQLTPSLILALQLPLNGSTDRAKAERFIEEYKDLWPGLTVQVKELQARKLTRGGEQNTTPVKRSVVHLKGLIDGREVLNQDAKLSIINGVTHHLSNGLDAVAETHRARITSDRARELALTHINLPLQTAALVKRGFVVSVGVAVEVFDVEVSTNPLQSHWVIRVNAVDGSVLNVSDRVRR